MPKLPDGSVVSSYFGTKPSDTGQSTKNQGLKTVIGQVDKVHFIDEATNISKRFVEYDVIVRDERGGQFTLKNVRCEAALGGSNDFDETILEPSEVAISGRLDASNLFANKNGTLVYVSFRDASFDKPYIEGCVPHPRKLGATKAEGIRKLGEFRGVQWSINKDGELLITYNGNRNSDGSLARPATGPTQIKINKQGALTITDNKGQRFSMDRTVKQISFDNGVTLLIDGQNDQFKAKAAGGGELNLKAGKVALGAGAVELLAKISDQLQELIDAFTSEASHTHDVTVVSTPSTVTSASPSNAGDMSSAASALTSIKSDIDGIKGLL